MNPPIEDAARLERVADKLVALRRFAQDIADLRSVRADPELFAMYRALDKEIDQIRLLAQGLDFETVSRAVNRRVNEEIARRNAATRAFLEGTTTDG